MPIAPVHPVASFATNEGIAMKIESVRELKHSVPKALARQFSRAGGRRATASVALARAASPRSVAASYALGIAAGRKKDGYRLALRLQIRELENSELVDAVRRAAKGEVDVRYIGRVTASTARRRAATPWYRQRQRPLLIGSSCGVILNNGYVMAGTLGCFVERRSGGRPMILSNNHVLADENRYAEGGRIVQPGEMDGGDATTDRVARLTSFVRLRRRPDHNYVDAAVATVDKKTEIDPYTMRGIGKLAGVARDRLDIGDEVHKVGRTTGVRHGRVTAFELDDLTIDYETGTFTFDNQIEIEGQGDRSFDESGDSGSLIVNDDLEAVALLFAGSDHGGSNRRGLTFANPIGVVFSRMKLKLAE
jgi:hypothetical protein